MTDIGSRDCIVVGGGLLGMLSAWYLSREGLSVALFEQGRICRESSWAGGGILSPLVPWEYPDAVSELVQWSQRHYPALVGELRDRSGIDPEWVQSGLLMVGASMSPAVSRWQERYPRRIEQLQPAAVRQLEPALGTVTGRALWLPEVAQIRNPRLCRALLACLRMQGVAVHEHLGVEGISTESGAVTGVLTSAGRLRAQRVIVAAGAWSQRVLAEIMPDLPVSPVRGQMIQFAADPGLLRHIVLAGGRYLIPRMDGLVLAGSTLEYAGFEKKTTREAMDSLAEFAIRLVPGLAGCRIVNHWAGLRPGRTGSIPLIGMHPEIKGLYVNAGHFRNGVVMGPASARLLLDIILERESFTATDPYRL